MANIVYFDLRAVILTLYLEIFHLSENLICKMSDSRLIVAIFFSHFILNVSASYNISINIAIWRINNDTTRYHK